MQLADQKMLPFGPLIRHWTSSESYLNEKKLFFVVRPSLFANLNNTELAKGNDSVGTIINK
jgi:hypothetical protein